MANRKHEAKTGVVTEPIWGIGHPMSEAPLDEWILCEWGGTHTGGASFDVLCYCDGVWMNMDEYHFFPTRWWPLPRREKVTDGWPED